MPRCKRLIQDALDNNLDLCIAAQRVLEAEAQVGIARSQQLPSISGGGSYSALQIPSSLAGTRSDGAPANSFFRGGGPSASAAWNLDFWVSIVGKAKLHELISSPANGVKERPARP